MPLSPEDKKALKRLIRRAPEEVAIALLSHSSWFSSLKADVAYQRFGDDTRLGFLTVSFSPDSDGWVEVLEDKDLDDDGSLRFRTFFGGGESLLVRQALLVLALAIKIENEKHPQHRKPADE